MKTDDELIDEIESRAVFALCRMATDKKEAERQIRLVRDNVRELQKQRAARSANIVHEPRAGDALPPKK